MKREAVNHTKMRRLARVLGIELWAARGIMESLWYVTREEAPSGDIGKLSDQDIADAIGWMGEPAALIQGLLKSSWLDAADDYRLIIHDWADHCEDHIHAKLVRAGLRFADGSIPNLNKLPKSDREKYSSADLCMPPVVLRINLNSETAVHEVKKAAVLTSSPRTLPDLTLPDLTEPHQAGKPPQRLHEAPPSREGVPTGGAVPVLSTEWKRDAAYVRFTEDYRSTGGSFIDEDFAEAFHFTWKRLDFEQKLERHKALKEHIQRNAWDAPRYVPMPDKFLKTEWKRPIRDPPKSKQQESTDQWNEIEIGPQPTRRV